MRRAFLRIEEGPDAPTSRKDGPPLSGGQRRQTAVSLPVHPHHISHHMIQNCARSSNAARNFVTHANQAAANRHAQGN